MVLKSKSKVLNLTPYNIVIYQSYLENVEIVRIPPSGFHVVQKKVVHGNKGTLPIPNTTTEVFVKQRVLYLYLRGTDGEIPLSPIAISMLSGKVNFPDYTIVENTFLDKFIITMERFEREGEFYFVNPVHVLAPDPDVSSYDRRSNTLYVKEFFVHTFYTSSHRIREVSNKK